MIESILLVILSVSTTVLSFLFLIQKNKNRELIKNTIEFLILQEEQGKIVKTDQEKANEDFLKFVSDSRDWAYSYIESVQEEINNFITLVGPDIDYLESYRPPIISDDATNRLIVGYKKIKGLLPDDYGKIDI